MHDGLRQGQAQAKAGRLARARLGAPVKALEQVRQVFHADTRPRIRHADCLAPDSYVASQTLAERLLDGGSLGVIYPSVRHPGGTNLACFRPALVANVRKAHAYRLTWAGKPEPLVETI